MRVETHIWYRGRMKISGYHSEMNLKERETMVEMMLAVAMGGFIFGASYVYNKRENVKRTYSLLSNPTYVMYLK